MSKEHAYAYEAGYHDGATHYELDHCPSCKNTADLQDALAENAKLRELMYERAHKHAIHHMTEDELRITAANVMAENAKLREQTERLVTLLRNDCDIEASWDGLRHFWSIELTEDGCLMRDRACKAEAENAKLHKLVDYMTPIALCSASERERDELRELGVEVPS